MSRQSLSGSVRAGPTVGNLSAGSGSASPSRSASTFTFSDASPLRGLQHVATPGSAARPAPSTGGIRGSGASLSRASSRTSRAASRDCLAGYDDERSASTKGSEGAEITDADDDVDQACDHQRPTVSDHEFRGSYARSDEYTSESSYGSESSELVSEEEGDNTQKSRRPVRNPEAGHFTGKFAVIAIRDYFGATDEELDLRIGDRLMVLDDGNQSWWYCRSIRHPNMEGYIPASFVCVEGEDSNKGNRRRGPPSLYGSGSIYDARVASAVSGSLNITFPMRGTKCLQTTDCFEYVPMGCRASTLAKIYNEGEFDAATCLAAKANADGLGFKDLFLDEKRGRLRQVPVKCNIAFSLVSARNIPSPVPKRDCRITGRQVRISIFDKLSVRSNILVVPAIITEEGWRFTTKTFLLFPKDDENTCLVRTNDMNFNLCVLFELCVAFSIGNADRGFVETGEASCGWGALPLYTADGNLVENKTYEIKLHGGTPYESDVELGDPVGKRGIWETLTNANRAPKLNVRLWSLGKSAMKRINFLPETLVTFLAYVPALAYYRQLQADAILVGKEAEPDLQVKFSPALAILERIVDQWDLMRALIVVWDLESRKIRMKDRRSGRTMRRHFARAVTSILPLLHCLDMPDYVPGDDSRDSVRAAFIEKYRNEGPITCLAAYPCTAAHEPFDVQELCMRPRLLPSF